MGEVSALDLIKEVPKTNGEVSALDLLKNVKKNENSKQDSSQDVPTSSSEPPATVQQESSSITRARQSIERRRQLLEQGTSDIVVKEPIYQNEANQGRFKNNVSKLLNKATDLGKQNIENIYEGAKEGLQMPAPTGQVFGNIMESWVNQAKEGKKNILGSMGLFAEQAAQSTAEQFKKNALKLKEPQHPLAKLRDLSIGNLKLGLDAAITAGSLTPAGMAFVGSLEGLKEVGVPEETINTVMSLASTAGQKTGILDENSPDWEKQLFAIGDLMVLGGGMHMTGKTLGMLRDGVSVPEMPKEARTEIKEAFEKVTENDIKAAATHPENPDLAKAEKKILDLNDDVQKVPDEAKLVVANELQKAEAEKQGLEQQEVQKVIADAHAQTTEEVKSGLLEASKLDVSEPTKKALEQSAEQITEDIKAKKLAQADVLEKIGKIKEAERLRKQAEEPVAEVSQTVTPQEKITSENNLEKAQKIIDQHGEFQFYSEDGNSNIIKEKRGKYHLFKEIPKGGMEVALGGRSYEKAPSMVFKTLDEAVKYAEEKRRKPKEENIPIEEPVNRQSISETAEVKTEERPKALETRVAEGETPQEVKDAIKEAGLTYAVEKHPQAEQKANELIEKIGMENALTAVRNNEIGGGAATFIRGRAINEIHAKWLTETDPALKEQLLQQEKSLIAELGEKLRTGGQEISAVQKVYTDSDLGYRLSGVLDRAETANLGKVVPKEVQDKLTDLTARLDEANKKISELKQQGEAIIIEEPVRKVRKPSLSAEEITRKTELRKKYMGSLNDVTRVITLLAEKEFREYAGLVLKESAGDFRAWSTEMINTVGKGIADHLEQLYKELGGTEEKLETIKARLKKQIAEYERKLKEKDFSKKEKFQTPLDREAFDLTVEKNKLKDQIDLEIERLQLKNRTLKQKIKDEFVDVANLPKSLIASADMSAPLRQGAILSIRHPVIGARAGVEMFRQAFSQARQTDWLARLKITSEYAEIKEAGLYLAEPTAKLSAKEEQFISNIAHKIPIWGRVVKGSERAYTGYLNKLRVDVFADFRDQLVKDGFKGDALKKELKSFADFINNASGRGSLGRFEEATPLANAIFFSPRYVASRFSLLNPVKYINMSPRARVEALKSVAAYAGTVAVVIAIAKAGGAEVESDPRSSDFGKIKIGDTRYDLMAGFQQIIRLISTLYSNKKKYSSGQVRELGKKFGDPTRADEALRFIRTKASPTAGVVWDWMAGKDVVGKEVTLTGEAQKLLIPLWIQGIDDIYKEQGTDAATAAGLASFFGVGVQHYESKKSKTK